jgi:hypothetical protein
MVRSLSLVLKTLSFAALLVLTSSQASAQATFEQYLSAANKTYGEKDYEKALRYYKAASQLRPESAPAHQGMGNCHYGLGRKSEALKSYERALDLDPSNSKLSSFVQRLRSEVGSGDGLPALDPMGSSTNTDLSMGLPESNKTLEDDSKKYNKWTSGRNYTKNILEIFLGPALYEGGSMGFGFGTGYYFPATRSLFVGVAQNMIINSGGGYTVFDFETLLLVKYQFEGETIRPMIFGGGGLDTTMALFSYGGYSDMDFGFYPELTVGGGVAFPLGNDVNVFAQGRIALQFGDFGTYTIIPIEIGFSFPVN